MGKLDNRVAIVVGGAGHAGEETSKLFAKEGAKVFIADINEELGKKFEKEIKDAGGEATFFKCDVTKPEQIKECVKACVEKYGKVDTLVNTACIMSLDTWYICDVTEEDFEKEIQINFKSGFIFMQEVIPYMLKNGKGRIVNFSSTAATHGQLGHALYGACKAAIEALTRTVATQYGTQNIRANAIRPGVFLYPALLEIPAVKEYADFTLSHVPNFRIGESADGAKLALFLASDDSDYINGQVVTLDGGNTIHLPQWKEDMMPEHADWMR